MNLKKALIVFFLVAVSFFFILPMQAYVLPGPYILDLMIEKLGKAQTLFVSQKLIFYRVGSPVDTQRPAKADDSEQPVDGTDDFYAEQDLEIDKQAAMQEASELDESLRFVFSQAFRSDVRSPESERIQIFNGGKTLTIIDGNIVPAAANRFDLYKDLLLYRWHEELADRLLELGVDVFVSSLGRFEEKIAFVIGVDYPDDSVSQLWIDQETFLPIRWIIKGANGAADSDALEVRYLLWWKIGQTRYPSRIEFYQDGNLVRVNQAKNFEEDAIFSEELFDIEHLKTVYPQAPAQPIVPVEPEEPSEVEKTIEEFKQIFE